MLHGQKPNVARSWGIMHWGKERLLHRLNVAIRSCKRLQVVRELYIYHKNWGGEWPSIDDVR